MRHRQTVGAAARAALLAMAVVLVSAAAALSAAGSGELDDAISLYNEAKYGEALQILEALDTKGDLSSDPVGQNAVAEYRALCLLALDRGPEARDVVKRLLARQPDYRPRTADLPPRFLVVVREARTEVLPALVRAEYREGKASYDRKAFGEAEAHLRKVVTLLANEDLTPAAREPLADIGDLATGFLAIIGRSTPESMEPLPAVEGGTRLAAPASPVVYSASDRGVTQPVIVRQDVPHWRTVGAESQFLRSAPRQSLLEVVIDEKGSVETARLRSPLHPLYDVRLLSEAKKWQYRPATLDGVPVRYLKLIEVKLVDPDPRSSPQAKEARR
jgi:tetratricopeptide (TPR) repeat protein